MPYFVKRRNFPKFLAWEEHETARHRSVVLVIDEGSHLSTSRKVSGGHTLLSFFKFSSQPATFIGIFSGAFLHCLYNAPSGFLFCFLILFLSGVKISPTSPSLSLLSSCTSFLPWLSLSSGMTLKLRGRRAAAGGSVGFCCVTDTLLRRSLCRKSSSLPGDKAGCSQGRGATARKMSTSDHVRRYSDKNIKFHLLWFFILQNM